MKTRNVDLKNTPLLVNNICKKICLKAPSLLELKKKVKEYELLLVRCLTNAYQLSKLSLDKKYVYTLLSDGNYQATMFLNFSGIKKEEISNPEKTLQYIKHLTAMESKGNDSNGECPRSKHKINNYHNKVFLPVEVKNGASETNVIADKQRQILEKLVTENDLLRVDFLTAMRRKNFETDSTTISLKVEYDYREIIEMPAGHSDPDEQGNR